MQCQQVIDTDDQIICRKHNSPALLISFQQGVSLQDQLLCALCLSEHSQMLSSAQPWKNVREMILQQQKARLSDFQSQFGPMIDLIQSLQSIIYQIKNKLMNTLDLIASTVSGWKKQLNTSLLNECKYTIQQELNIIINKYHTDQRVEATQKYNRQFFNDLKQQAKSLSLSNEFIQLKEVLKQLLTFNQQDNENQTPSISLSNQVIISLLEQAISSIKCSCSDHKKLITMINIDKDIGSEKRALCTDCKLQNGIPLVKFEELWIKYQGELKVKQLKSQANLRLKVNQLKLQITQVKEYCNQNLTNCIDLLEEQVYHGIKFNQMQQRKLNEPITLEKLQSQARELSRREDNYQIEDHNSELLVLKKQLLAKLNDVAQSLSNQINEITKNVETAIINLGYRKITCSLSQEIQQQEACLAVAFNQDGSIMAATCDAQIKIWQLNSGKLKQTDNVLSGHTENVYCLVFSRKMNWFASGGRDSTIRCWKEIKQNNWVSSQPGTSHLSYIQCLLLTKNEDQLLSCSGDKSIKVWNVDCNNNILTYHYSLDKHTEKVYCISLNESETSLVSCSFDKSIIIWEQGQLHKWEFKYYITKSTDGYGKRITFMSDNMMAWQQYSQGITHIFQLDNGVFKERPELKILLNQVSEDSQWYSLFPSVYNRKRKVLIQKHNNFVFIIGKQNDGQFKVYSQPIDCNSDCNYGGLTECGQNLVIWNGGTNQLRLYTINYE